MSLSRALTELFRAIREEAANNPAFAARLGEAAALYKPPKRKPRAARPARPAAEPLPPAEPEPPAPFEAPPARPDLNPFSLFSQEGEAALRSTLAGGEFTRDALAALVAEHNLDPAGETEGGDKDALVEQIVAQARKRVERDSKLFNY